MSVNFTNTSGLGNYPNFQSHYVNNFAKNQSSSPISFKSNTLPNSTGTTQPEKKNNNGIKGFLLGAALVGAAAFLLTRGKVKPSSIKPRVLKTNELINTEHLTNYANTVKKYSGNAVDRINFVKGDELSKFIKNKNYTNLAELAGLESLTEKEIVAVAMKEENPLFTTIFSSTSGLDVDVIAALKNGVLSVTL